MFNKKHRQGSEKLYKAGIASCTGNPGIRAFILFLGIIGLSLFSCDVVRVVHDVSGASMHSIEILLPPLPSVWSGITSIEYQAVWNIDGIEKRSLAVTAGSIRIEVPRGKCTPLRLLATAVFLPEGIRYEMRPAGAIYPFDACCNGDSCSTSWEWGYLAEVAVCLQKVKARAEDYNFVALSSLLREYPDPWTIAPEKVARSLVSGRFNKTVFDTVQAITVRLPAGNWFPENPVYRPVMDTKASSLDGKEALSVAAVTNAPADTSSSEGFEPSCLDIPTGSSWALLPGIHRFVGASGILVLAVQETGSVVMVHSGNQKLENGTACSPILNLYGSSMDKCYMPDYCKPESGTTRLPGS